MQECEEIQSEKCEEKEIKIPKQIKEHKKKCLLPDDGAFPVEATTTPYVDPNDPYPVTTEKSLPDDNIYSGNENNQIARFVYNYPPCFYTSCAFNLFVKELFIYDYVLFGSIIVTIISHFTISEKIYIFSFLMHLHYNG